MSRVSQNPLLLEDSDTTSTSNRSLTPPPTYEVVMQEKGGENNVYSGIAIGTALFFIFAFIVLYVYYKKE